MFLAIFTAERILVLLLGLATNANALWWLITAMYFLVTMCLFAIVTFTRSNIMKYRDAMHNLALCIAVLTAVALCMLLVQHLNNPAMVTIEHALGSGLTCGLAAYLPNQDKAPGVDFLPDMAGTLCP